MNCNKIFTDFNCNLHIIDNDFNCHYVQIFVLKLHNSEESQTFVREERMEDIVFSTQGDGFYTITRITVPKDESALWYYKDGKIYHGLREEFTIPQFIEINLKTTDLDIDYIHYFSVCNLKKCFIAICQQIFETNSSICKKADIDSTIIYKRDLLWSALNVIKYLVDMDQYEEAQRILDEITECNGLCPQHTGTRNCGCGR